MWGVFRLDDNGNLFLMNIGGFTSYDDKFIADGIASYYNQLGHKQLYFVDEIIQTVKIQGE